MRRPDPVIDYQLSYLAEQISAKKEEEQDYDHGSSIRKSTRQHALLCSYT
jgi:hypothetical protein